MPKHHIIQIVCTLILSLLIGACGSSSSDDVNLNTDSRSVSNTDNLENVGTLKLAAVQALFSEPHYNCTNSTCHDSTPGAAKIDLLTGTNQDLANRLLGQASSNSNCADEVLIDVTDINNSLMLKLLSRHSTDTCSVKMPFGTNGILDEDYDTVVEWVRYLADNYTVTMPGTDGDSNNAVSPTPPLTSLNKIKSFLTGEAVTATDYSTAVTDSGQLNNQALTNELIDDWMTSDLFYERIEEFLMIGLQQKLISDNDNYTNQLSNIENMNQQINSNRMRENLEEMFTRTALAIVENDQDFREVVTTRTWQVTTALLAALSYADNPRSELRQSFSLLPGLTNNDYQDWRPVTFVSSNQSANFEFTENFSSQMRSIPSGGTLNLMAPRVGFFNSFMFMHNWATNDDNQFRINVSQTLLAALNLAYEAGDTTNHNHLIGLDTDHSTPATDCRACHRLLDPARNVFMNVYDARYQRAKVERNPLSGDFSFHGVSQEINDIDELAQAIADHPRFALAWTEKLCYWLNGSACTDQTSLQQVANTFESSGFNFKTLVKTLITSPMTTGSTITSVMVENSLSTLSASRQYHLCHMLKSRIQQARSVLGLAPLDNTSAGLNVCDTNATRSLTSNIPEDSYSRGFANFNISTSDDAFLAITKDSFCSETASLVVGNNTQHTFRGNQTINNAISTMVEVIMGIPNNAPDYDETFQTFRNLHRFSVAPSSASCTADDFLPDADSYQCGLGLSKINGFRVVWKAACLSPNIMAIGF